MSVSFDARMISMTRSMLMTAMPRPSTISRRGARLAQLEQRAARDDLAAVLDEDLQRALERQQHRAAVDDREHVDAERRLQRGHA